VLSPQGGTEYSFILAMALTVRISIGQVSSKWFEKQEILVADMVLLGRFANFARVLSTAREVGCSPEVFHE